VIASPTARLDPTLACARPSQLLLNRVLRRPLESAQYTSIDYTQTLTDHHVLASVGSVGDAYDNALAESFVDSFKTELIADRVWRTRNQLELAIVEWIGWFNTVRLHSALGDRPPMQFERTELSAPTVPGLAGFAGSTHTSRLETN
jgi:transposase InsO family protein